LNHIGTTAAVEGLRSLMHVCIPTALLYNIAGNVKRDKASIWNCSHDGAGENDPNHRRYVEGPHLWFFF